MTHEIDPRRDRGGETSGHQKTWPALVSVLCFLWAGYAAVDNKVNSISQVVIFAATLSIGLGGLTSIVASMGGSRININLGWLKATGVYAIVLAIFIFMLHGFHVINFLRTHQHF
jgi:hypothetical protein